MELYEREFLIYRIRAGYTICNINNNKLFVYSPDPHLLYLAQEIYIDTYRRAKDHEIFEDDDVFKLLVSLNIWSDQKENELNDVLPKHIDYWKVELYNAFFKSNKRKTIRQYLARAKEEQANLYSIRHCFDHITCTGCASYAKNLFLISNTTKTCDNKSVDWNSIDINTVMGNYYSQSLSTDEIRVLARTYPWNTLWPLLKENKAVFENANFSSEQQALLYWSIMYDRVAESTECPSEDVVNDDDMLDGWLIIQRQKRDEEHKKREVEGQLPNSKTMNADEVFLMAETIEDAKKIELLNDPIIRQMKAQKFKEIDEKGIVREQDLTDVKRKQMMLANQAYIEKMRNRRG